VYSKGPDGAQVAKEPLSIVVVVAVTNPFEASVNVLVGWHIALGGIVSKAKILILQEG
jgi:hypothetical protein